LTVLNCPVRRVSRRPPPPARIRLRIPTLGCGDARQRLPLAGIFLGELCT